MWAATCSDTQHRTTVNTNDCGQSAAPNTTNNNITSTAQHFGRDIAATCQHSKQVRAARQLPTTTMQLNGGNGYTQTIKGHNNDSPLPVNDSCSSCLAQQEYLINDNESQNSMGCTGM